MAFGFAYLDEETDRALAGGPPVGSERRCEEQRGGDRRGSSARGEDAPLARRASDGCEAHRRTLGAPRPLSRAGLGVVRGDGSFVHVPSMPCVVATSTRPTNH
jgi:hypothetical protein